MTAKYVLEKAGKASIHTDSESVRVRYLADGFTVKTKPAAVLASSSDQPKNK